MKEEYFKEVILKITELCEEERSKNCDNENSDELIVSDAFLSDAEIERLMSGDFYRKNLEKYLQTLSDKTINVICALMDFGKNNMGKVLPINLNKLFNKVYLPYWFNMNYNQNKENIIDYLNTKKDLDKYLNRAKNILFYSKDDNIEFKCKCGGLLYLNSIELFDSNENGNEYALHLNCFWCDDETIKYVDEDFLNYKTI